MTDYEIAMIFYEALDAVISHFMNFVSILSAFLLAGYFGAQLLTRIMIAIILGLYSVVIFYLSFSTYQEMRSFSALVGEVQTRIDAGSEALAWHAAQHAPAFAIPMGPPIILSIMILSYIASLAFFYERWRSGAQIIATPAP